MEDKPRSTGYGVPRLPPGFRFHPTDEELVLQYLKRKVYSSPLPSSIIPDVDHSNYNPWDLPACGWYSNLISDTVPLDELISMAARWDWVVCRVFKKKRAAKTKIEMEEEDSRQESSCVTQLSDGSADGEEASSGSMS
ncbi:hypothetical protein GW17_00000405 [Ensete ventricosum]|nr:hypothetical protein GW17_00000405 [Ensete ventricosum]